MDFGKRSQKRSNDVVSSNNAEGGTHLFSRRQFLSLAGAAVGGLVLFNAGFISDSLASREAPHPSIEDIKYPAATGSIMLASFFNSESDQSNTLYASTNGTFFEKISVAYQDANPGDPKNNWVYRLNDRWQVNPQRDPSIIYRDGWFFMLSGFTDHIHHPGQIVPMIGYSEDLVHWSYPNSGKPVGQNVQVSEYPAIDSTPLSPSQFDMVAPDWMMDDDGTAWIVASIGYFGQFHGEPQNDTMFPYLIKVSDLAPAAERDPIAFPNAKVCANYGKAKPIRLPKKSTNRIDGSLYKEDGTYYLSIKDCGVTNEIWSTNSLDHCDQEGSWTLVNEDVVTGFEAPSLTKYNKTYYFYNDKLADYPPGSSDGKNGIHVTWSDRLDGGWAENRRIIAADCFGKTIPCRHGTVITLSGQAAQKVWDCRRNAGWPEFDFATNFDDVKLEMAKAKGKGETVWYVEEGWLSFAVRSGIMSGYADSNDFGPYDPVSRSQAVVMLHRLDDGRTPVADGEGSAAAFGDVAADAYYREAVGWACAQGLLSARGYGGGALFCPEDAITREELAVVVARYAGLRGLDVQDKDRAAFDAMEDCAEVSSWAVDGMAWCCANGIMSGASGQQLDPAGTVWRASMAKVLAVLSGLVGR